MKALPATVLEAEAVAVVSTASAGACTLTSGDAGTNRSAGGRSLCRQALPRSRGGLRQMVRAPQRVPLASTCVRFSSAIGDGVSFLASLDPT
jgi:hypothetical protein